MKEMVLAILLVSIFIIVLFVFLILTTRRINILVKRAYMNKLQDLDFLIEEKEENLNSIYNRIKDAESELQYIEKQKEELSIIPELHEKNLAVVMPKADYVDNNFKEQYRKLKSTFSFNKNKKIRKFLSEYVKEETSNNYKVLLNIKNYFSFEVIYKLSTYPQEEQKIIITDLLNEEEKKVVQHFLKESKFNINKFLADIDNELLSSNEAIIIYVNNDQEDYSGLNPNIVMKVDKNIIEGFKIVYKGVVYDYSV